MHALVATRCRNGACAVPELPQPPYDMVLVDATSSSRPVEARGHETLAGSLTMILTQAFVSRNPRAAGICSCTAISSCWDCTSESGDYALDLGLLASPLEFARV
ncbi:hypothetical protein VTO73DRAFT_6696 [Trametes versicolor]